MNSKDFLENDFNPEFSEYNPLLAELHGKKPEKEDEGFIASFLKKFSTSVLITEW